MKQKKLFRNLAVLTGGAVIVIGLWFNRYNLWDWWRLRGYQPDQAIVHLADETTMTDSTRRVFYAYHPALEQKAEFNGYCRRDSKEQTIVLGCYIGGRGIHLLDVNDDRLIGIEEVTAAHELLHAAYARLNFNERERIDKLTAAVFASIEDERIKATVESYRKQDDSVIPNELHSILGTEVANLSPELEEYYKRYFNDRSKIVLLSEQYENNFVERKNQIQDYDALLAAIKQQIDSLQAELEVANQELTSQRAQLDSLKRSNQVDAYNQLRVSYNNKVTSYNSNIDKLGRLISEYNDIVPKRNAIVSEEEELVGAIDSREVPASR